MRESQRFIARTENTMKIYLLKKLMVFVRYLTILLYKFD